MLLRLRIMEDKNIRIDCFFENMCGESFLTVNRYGILKIIVSDSRSLCHKMLLLHASQRLL
ncbi:hypothetical protein Hanom_Chr14g01276301 [Helianthus anomalus]